MPRRSQTVTIETLRALLGPGTEITDWILEGARRVRVHRGWRWACACAAFARAGEQRYVWVACTRHDQR